MVYQFRCSVCEGKFTSKGSWLRHLLEPRHSDLARAELIKNWSGEETRQCLIVAYSKEAVGKDERILQFFSKDRHKGIVTNFVWWKERPGIGFIQFESRKVAKSMIASLDNHQIVLDNQPFQFRHADTLLDLEWDNLLSFLPEKVEENKDPLTKKIQPKENLLKKQSDSFKQLSSGTRTFKNYKMSRYNSFLQDLLDYVESQVKIPIKICSWSIQAATNLRRILSEGDTKIINEGEEISVTVIRNWCLGLNKNAVPFIGVKVWNKSEGHLVDYGNKFTVAEVANIFHKATFASATHTNNEFQICNDRHSKASLKSCSGMKIKFTGSSKGTRTRIPFSIKFTLSGNIELAEEIQLWHFANYLMSFDERCDAVMQVVYLWANLNSIKIGKFTDSATNNSPDWTGLVWMVLFFLYASDREDGRKIIPTPSEILDRKGYHHDPIYFGKVPNQVDIGFTPDQDFKDAWQKKNESKTVNSISSVEVFNLVYQFFCFWDGFSEESWIINSREGKYYRTEEFLKFELDPNDPSNKDFLRLQEKHGEVLKDWKEKNTKHCGILHMSSPFNIFWRIPLSLEALKPFKAMKDKLQVLLNGLENNQLDVKPNPDSFVHFLFEIEQKGKQM